jgi:hypothetical protein
MGMGRRRGRRRGVMSGRWIMRGKVVKRGVCRGGIGEGIIGGLVTHIRVKGGREDEGRATRQGRGE